MNLIKADLDAAKSDLIYSWTAAVGHKWPPRHSLNTPDRHPRFYSSSAAAASCCGLSGFLWDQQSVSRVLHVPCTLCRPVSLTFDPPFHLPSLLSSQWPRRALASSPLRGFLCSLGCQVKAGMSGWPNTELRLGGGLKGTKSVERPDYCHFFRF